MVLTMFGALAMSAAPVGAASRACGTHWTGSYLAPQALTSSAPSFGGIGGDVFDDQTLRMIVSPHVAGTQLRFRMSNRWGVGTVSFDAVRVARQREDAAVRPDTIRKVTFGGAEVVSVPAGGSATSDPVALDVRPFEHLAITFHVIGGPVTLDVHPEANQVSYVSPAGSGAVSDDAEGAAFTTTTTRVFVVDRLDVLADQVGGTVVTFGDSITDGAASTHGEDNRYPDWLQRRLSAELPRRHIGVLNAGIGGNAASMAGLGGPSGVSRFTYDVVANPEVTDVIVMLGTNDSLLYHRSAAEIIEALQNIGLQARDAGIHSVIATLTPFGSEPQPEVRAAVQDWIRKQTVYDAVVDFEKALEDPSQPGTMDSRYWGDPVGLHPNDDGYKRMAEEIDIQALRGNGCFGRGLAS